MEENILYGKHFNDPYSVVCILKYIFHLLIVTDIISLIIQRKYFYYQNVKILLSSQ